MCVCVWHLSLLTSRELREAGPGIWRLREMNHGHIRRIRLPYRSMYIVITDLEYLNQEIISLMLH